MKITFERPTKRDDRIIADAACDSINTEPEEVTLLKPAENDTKPPLPPVLDPPDMVM